MGLELFIVLLIVINIIGFLLMKADKERAKQQRYRISEKTLWFIAFIGGATGMTMGMQKFRHKTKHLTFKLGLPFMTMIQLLAIFLLFY